jgi:ankyrin repeat protein
MEPFFFSALRNDVRTIEEFLQNGANPNASSEKGVTALSLAAQEGHVHTARVLLDRGANPDQPYTDKTTPLMLAAQNGHVELVRLLLKYNANPFLSKDSGCTAIHVASKEGYGTIVEILLKQGCKDQAPPPSIGIKGGEFTAHAIATFQRHLHVAKLLSFHRVANTAYTQALKAIKRLSHVFKLSGTAKLYEKKKKSAICTVDLEGAQPSYWMHQMSKHIKSYKGTLACKKTQDQLANLLESSSKHPNAKELFANYKEEMPLLLEAGHSAHATIFLIWKSQLWICNRNGSQEQPIQIFDIDPSQITESFIAQTQHIRKSGDRIQYAAHIANLKHSKTHIHLENAIQKVLPYQRVGNCSWDSLEGIVFIFVLLGLSRGKNMIHWIGNTKSQFTRWLEHLQVHSAEKSLKDYKKSGYKIDKQLMKRVFNELNQLSKKDTTLQKAITQFKKNYSKTLSWKQRIAFQLNL